MLDKYILSAYFFDGQVKIGSENDLDVFLLGKKHMHGLYEVSCSADRRPDPIYQSKSDESFALAAAAQKYLTKERSCGTNGWGMLVTSCRRTGKIGKPDVNLKSAPDEVACAGCVQAKLPASSMNHSLVPEGTKIGELVFSDTCGEMPVLGYNQEWYFITFTDAASTTLFVEVLKNKKTETVLAAFKKVHNTMKNVFSHSIKRLHTDNGSEYDNDLILGYLEDEGIEHTTTAPYQPQNNGIAERVNRILMGKVRAMLLRFNLGHEFWPYAVLNAAYLHNRTPSSTSGSVTPYERLYGCVPSLENLRIFGCLAHAKAPDEKRKKLFEKSIRTALLECLPGMQYKLLDLDNGDIHYV
jgi:Integrase core domain